MESKKMKIEDCELEIEKRGRKVMVSQQVTIIEADGSEHVEDWLIAEGEVVTLSEK